MTIKPITFVCVQPASLYYAWQVEVMLTNFESLLIHEHYNIQCLFAYNKRENEWQKKVQLIERLEKRFEAVASFHYYQDTRSYPISYIPSIRPNILKQHLANYPSLGSVGKIFYHDCDIVFTRFPQFLEQIYHDDLWYVSNTISYLSYDYILSKGEDILDKMCEIVGIDKELVKQNNMQSGGAQYLMSGVDFEFFDKVERDCETLHREISKLSNEKVDLDPTYHALQIWCADMWSLLWNAWIKGKETHIIQEMNFCWATDFIGMWDSNYIYHNSGVTLKDKDTLFFKGAYIRSLPYDDEFEGLSKNKCSYKYVEIIKSLRSNSQLIEQNDNHTPKPPLLHP